MNRMFRIALRWLQRRCDHADMRADIGEGSLQYMHERGSLAEIKWCPTCGAVKVGSGELRMPEPTWFSDLKRAMETPNLDEKIAVDSWRSSCPRRH